MLQHNLHHLASGLTVLAIPMPAVESLTVLALANTGSRYESPEQFGVAHFFEHMVFKGTRKYQDAQQLASVIDGVGADFNAFTSKEYTGYYVKSAAKHFDLALDVVSEMLLAPKLDQEDIDREKGVIIEELNMYVDSPQRHIENLFDQLVFAGSGLGHDIIGTKTTIQNLQRADFQSFLSKWYGLGNMVLIVAGDERVVAGAGFLPAIEQAFGKQIEFDRQPTATVADKLGAHPISGQLFHLEFRETQQAHFVMGWPGIARTSPDRYTQSLLSILLGGNMSSRLFSEVREKRGLCYYVHSAVDQFHDTGMFGAAAGVDPARLEEAIKVTIGEFVSLANGTKPFTAAELQRAKEFLAGKMVLGLEDSESVAQYYGMKQLLTGEIESPEEVLEKVQAVTLEEVHALASRLIVPGSLRFALIGPFREPDQVNNWVTAAQQL